MPFSVSDQETMRDKQHCTNATIFEPECLKRAGKRRSGGTATCTPRHVNLGVATSSCPTEAWEATTVDAACSLHVLSTSPTSTMSSLAPGTCIMHGNEFHTVCWLTSNCMTPRFSAAGLPTIGPPLNTLRLTSAYDALQNLRAFYQGIS